MLMRSPGFFFAAMALMISKPFRPIALLISTSSSAISAARR
jgi:hypothetical protein